MPLTCILWSGGRPEYASPCLSRATRETGGGGHRKDRRNQEDRNDVVPEIEALLEGVNIKNDLRKCGCTKKKALQNHMPYKHNTGNPTGCAAGRWRTEGARANGATPPQPSTTELRLPTLSASCGAPNAQGLLTHRASRATAATLNQTPHATPHYTPNAETADEV